MPVYFSDIWNMYLYNRDEDPAEAYVIIPQEPPVLLKNEQPVDIITSKYSSSGLEASNTETPNAEERDISNPDSCAGRSLLNSSQNESGNGLSKSDLVATDTSFPIIHYETSSRVLDASDTETPNAEKLDISEPGSITKRDLNLLDKSKNEAENVQFKSDLVATDTSFPKICVVDSNREIFRYSPQTSNKSIQISSSPAEDKLRRKLFMFETISTIVGLTVPMLTIGIGVENIGNCPADFLVPYLVLIIGVLSLLIVSHIFVKSYRKNFDSWTEFDKNVTFKTSIILSILWLWKDMRFFTMDPSFDSIENYCNFKFYIFNIYLDVLLGLGFIIGICLFDWHSKRRLNPVSFDDGHFMKFD